MPPSPQKDPFSTSLIPVNGITVLSVIQAHDPVVKREKSKSLCSFSVYSIPPVETLPQGAVIYLAQWTYTIINMK